MCTVYSTGTMTLRPDSQGLYRARGQVRDMLQQLNLSDDDRDHLLIAVGEAISNAYLHGTPDPRFDNIRVAWKWAGDELTITVKDNGNAFSQGLHFRATEQRGSLARGLELMRAGADEVGFSYDNGANVVLTKRLAEETAA